jgi:hypothetical protein
MTISYCSHILATSNLGTCAKFQDYISLQMTIMGRTPSLQVYLLTYCDVAYAAYSSSHTHGLLLFIITVLCSRLLKALMYFRGGGLCVWQVGVIAY